MWISEPTPVISSTNSDRQLVEQQADVDVQAPTGDPGEQVLRRRRVVGRRAEHAATNSTTAITNETATASDAEQWPDAVRTPPTSSRIAAPARQGDHQPGAREHAGGGDRVDQASRSR